MLIENKQFLLYLLNYKSYSSDLQNYFHYSIHIDCNLMIIFITEDREDWSPLVVRAALVVGLELVHPTN